MSRRRRPKAIRLPMRNPQPNARQVIGFISSLVRTQVGTDEAPSALLRSMTSDLGARLEDVELAQDIALLGVDVMDVIADAVESGNIRSATIPLLALIGAALPEIEEDIRQVRDNLPRY